MYDIKQFKPTLYVLILMGITGFALSAEAPGLWVISVALVLANVWLIWTGQFRPISRLLANIVTLLGFFYVFLQVGSRTGNAILAIGQFLVLLQVVKVWEQRANRDFAQLLVLSLLLMVAAAISTASLVFGLMLIAYLFLSLYCCLLFHLKTETTNQAKVAAAICADQRMNCTLKQDQRPLSVAIDAPAHRAGRLLRDSFGSDRFPVFSARRGRGFVRPVSMEAPGHTHRFQRSGELSAGRQDHAKQRRNCHG